MKPLLTASLLALTAGALWAEDRALVIGIDDYTALPDPVVLTQAAADATRLAAFLTDRAGFAPEQVTLLTDSAATSDGVMNAVIDELIGQTAPGDRVVLYFAGLGTTATGADGTVLPALMAADAGAALGQMPADLFADLFDLAQGRQVTILLDTAFSGGGRGMPGAAPADLSAFGGGPDRMVWTASTPGEAAWESADGGLFTAFLLEGMDGVADRDGDRIVTNGELAAHLQTRSAAWCAADTTCAAGSLTPTFAGVPEAPALIPDHLLPQPGDGTLPAVAPLTFDELLAFVTDLFGPSNAAGLQLDLSAPQPMAIGTPVTFGVASRQDGALILLDIGTDGRLRQIFPSALAPNEGGSITSGQTVTIPSGASANGLPLRVTVSGPEGRGILLALFTARGTADDLAQVLPQGIDLDGLPDAGPLLFGVAQKLLQRDADPGQALEWSATFVPYEVVP